MANIKENVKNLLTKYPQTRNSDKSLQYFYWTMIDNCKDLEDWLEKGTDPESIRRYRQLLQVEFKELRAVKEVQEFRFQKQLEFLEITK